jgi:PAS domain S-box-containing protein
MNRAVSRFCWPILFTAAALGLRILLTPWLGTRLPYATFYISVTLSAILGGAIPGLLAIVLGTMASVYFFIPPIHSLWIAGSEHAALSAMDGAISLVLVLLAERQRRTAALATEGWRMLEAVMDYIPEGLTIVRAPDASVRMMSRKGAELLGDTRESIEGQTIADFTSHFYHADSKTPARVDEMAGMRAMQHGEITDDLEWIVKRPDGSAAVILSRAAPIRDSRGRIMGSVTAWRDITERKRLEEKVRESAKSESLGILAGGIAHDFNNLLTSVMGHASLLTNDLPKDGTAWRSAQEISSAAERAARLSRQMLSYSGRGRFQVGPLNLSEFVRHLAPKIESSISNHVQLTADLADDLPPIEADVSQMKELISNLVCNGVEAIGSGAGRVTIATRLLFMDHVYSQAPLVHEEIEPGTYVALDVSDTGSGMDQDTLARIFDPFFTTKFLGRGLGLAAVLGIVRGHNAKILVYSAPAQGTTISVLFPTAVQATADAASEVDAAQPAEEGSGAVVLAIDGEELTRSGANQALQKLGYTVLTAAGGTEGIEILRSLPDRSVVVLLDMAMPGVRGEETLRALREVRPDVPVVLSCGCGEAEARRRFGHLPAQFLQKPYSFKLLAERVHEAVAARLPTV